MKHLDLLWPLTLVLHAELFGHLGMRPVAVTLAMKFFIVEKAVVLLE